jgi:hypothetical protein
MSDTARLNLPLILAEQAQKHVTHNEALTDLDALVQASAIAEAEDPPAEPEEGDIYLCAAGATGAWSGQDDAIAHYAGGAWRFHTPGEGWRIWIADDGSLRVRNGSGWDVIAGNGLTLGNLVGLGIGTAPDATNRLAARTPSALFTSVESGAGGSGDIRVVLNKEASGDTASLVLQSGFSGRAEIGLAGEDDLSVKVSTDGAVWTEALHVDAEDGTVGFPKGVARLRGLMLDATWAAIAAMDIAPARTRSFLLDDTIGALQAAGLWAKLDVLYLLAAHDAQAARINIRAPKMARLTAFGATTFTTDRGYTGDGSAAYLGSGFVPGAAGSVYGLASAHCGAFVLNNLTSAGFAVGASGAGGDLALSARTAGGTLSGRINDLGPALTAAVPTSVGHSVVSRAAGTRTLFKAGASVATGALAATALPTGELTVLRAGAGYGPWQVAAAHAGSGLTAPEGAALHSILTTYLTAVGAI